MPKKVCADWNKTSKTLLKSLGDLHTKCGSVVFGFVVNSRHINFVASSHLQTVASDSRTHDFIRRVTGLQNVYSPVEIVPVSPPVALVKTPTKEHDSRVATLINTVNSPAFQQQAEQFLFFTVKPGTLEKHFQSSPHLSGVQHEPFWQQRIEGALLQSAYRTDATATGTSTSRRQAAPARASRREPAADASTRRVRRRQADGILQGLDAQEGTDQWYATRLQLDPSLYTPIRLPNYFNPTTGVEERCWALPNLDLVTASVGRTPVQVCNSRFCKLMVCWALIE